MTVWVLQQALTEQEEATIENRTDLVLPFSGLPDLTHVSSPQEARRLLTILYPGDPPEALNRRLDRFWHHFTTLQAGDLVAVPLPASKQVVLAEVSGAYHYEVGDKGSDIHMVPVRWYPRRIPMAKFRSHLGLFEGAALKEVMDADDRNALRLHLPHSYNRFAKWRWILGLLLAMGLLRMLIRVSN